MNKLVLVLALLSSEQSFSLSLEFIDAKILPTKEKISKSKIGGLSALYFDSQDEIMWAVSDDRGKASEPRIYEFSLKVVAKHLAIEPKTVHFIKRRDKGLLNTVLDMEGVAILPWGNFLISSEGDNNSKPRVAPELLDVKKDGTWVRSFQFPDKFIPEKTGKQSKGIRNNRGFEALTKSPVEEKYFLIQEESLLQDSQEDVGPVRILLYEVPEAWVIKPTKEFIYLPAGADHEDKLKTKSRTGPLELGGRVAEALAMSSTELLVLERTVALSAQGISYRCKIFLVELAGATDVSSVSSLVGVDLNKVKVAQKRLILDLEELKEKLGGQIENFEGLAFGPEVDKKKTILMVSDDNFKKSERTQVVLLKIID